MNKEYKLLQKYPGLPNDWEVGMIVGKGDRVFGYAPCHGKYKNVFLDNGIVENNPEYWVEHSEIDFEILCLSFNIKGQIGRTSDKTIIKGFLSGEIQYYDLKIVQISRNSDKKRFQIGDTIQIKRGPYGLKNVQIKEFQFSNGTLKIIYQLEPIRLFTQLENITKVKKRELLFVSEDGVEIFEGDSWWYVIPSQPKKEPRKTNTLVYKGYNDKPTKKFSTKEKAQEFLNSIGPLFVSEDGVQIFEGDSWFYVTPISKYVQQTNTLIYKGNSTVLEVDIKKFANKSNAEKYFNENYAKKYSKSDIKKVLLDEVYSTRTIENILKHF